MKKEEKARVVSARLVGAEMEKQGWLDNHVITASEFITFCYAKLFSQAVTALMKDKKSKLEKALKTLTDPVP